MTTFGVWMASALLLRGGALPSTSPAEPARPTAAGPEGFVIQSESGDFRLRIGGLAQGDGRFFLTADDHLLTTDSFLLRRARPIVQGTVARRFDFYVNPDFGDGRTVLQDAYLDARFSPQVRLRVGKFKTPFGRERLQSASNLLFVERALPTNLVPNRDVGVQLHGEIGGGVLSYAAALLNGVFDGASADLDLDDGKDVALRVFSHPFRKGRARGLGLGLAATFGRQQGPLVLIYRTPGQAILFNSTLGVLADGTRMRLTPQAHFYGGPVGVLTEYVRSSQEARKDEAAPLTRITNHAWQAAVSWLITGEKAGAGALAPRRPFDPAKGGGGALELAVRVHGLRVDEEAFARGLADAARSARRAAAWGVGLNWYLNRNVKYVVNFERTRFEGGRAGGDRETENVFLFRAQVAF